MTAMPRPRSSPPKPDPTPSDDDGIDRLTYSQARTALDLILAELQSSDLEVEAMADLYRRGQRYADRCEAVLRDVEQDVMQWDPHDPEAPAQPFRA